MMGQGEQRVSAMLNDRISRAFLLEDTARELALDANARLITELRLIRAWPTRQHHMCAYEDDAA